MFNLEPLEAAPRIDEAIKLCQNIKASFEDTRQTIKKAATTPLWEFETTLVLGRLAKYESRLHQLREVTKTRCDFEKLEKVELSNPMFNEQVVSIFNEYNEMYTVWAKRTAEEGEGTYDPLDPTSLQFDGDFKTYSNAVVDYDRRLSSIARLVFKEHHDIEGTFKLIHGWQGLLEHRDVLFEETADRYPELLEDFSNELDIVKELFDTEEVIRTVNKNMPPIAGTMTMNECVTVHTCLPYHIYAAVEDMG